jgi:membrane protein DedA with SNARE-associated domain
MSQFLDRLERVRGLPVLVGVALVLLNFIVRCVAFALVPADPEPSFLLFLFTDGNLLLHLGVIVGLLGVLIGDIL